MDIFAHDEADGAALYGLSGSETKTFYGKFAFEITCCFRGEITLAPGAMREIVLSLFLLFAGLSAVASSQVQALLLPESAAGTPYIFKAPASLLGEGEVNAGGYSSSERTGVPAAGAVEPAMHVLLKDCPYDQTHARECRVHWAPLAIESSLFLAFENAGNLYTGYSYRWDTTHGKWWDRYINSVKDFRFNRWSDDNPWYDDYVGHPMMGAITDFIWIQNDPKGMTLEFSNTSPYWISRLRAMTFSALYSLEWKIGPVGEASISHNDYYFPENVGGPWTNETGWVTLVTTPVGGTLWAVGEDLLDRSVIQHLENKSRNPFLLLSYQFLNPARGFVQRLPQPFGWFPTDWLSRPGIFRTISGAKGLISVTDSDSIRLASRLHSSCVDGLTRRYGDHDRSRAPYHTAK